MFEQRLSNLRWQRCLWLVACTWLFIVATCFGQSASEAISRGNELLSRSMPANALDQFLIAASLEPDNIEAIRGIARAQEWLGRWPEAITAYRQLVSQQSADTDSWFALGKLYSWNNELEHSYSAFERALSLRPDNLDIQLAYAEVLSWNSTRRTESIHRYRDILQRNPESIEAQLGLAQALSWSGVIREAELIYHRVLDLQPSRVAALVGLAEIARWNLRLLTSRDLLLRAQALAPEDRAVLLGLAETELAMGQYNRAMMVATTGASRDVQAFQQLQDRILKLRRPFVSIEYLLRQEPQSNTAPVNANGATAVIGIPLPRDTMLQFRYQPTIYQSQTAIRNANDYAIKWDGGSKQPLSYEIEGAVYSVPRDADTFGGRISIGYQSSDATRFTFGMDRTIVIDSLQSIFASEHNGIISGRIHSNRSSLGIVYRSFENALDAYGTLLGGYYHGRNLQGKWQTQLDAGLGKSLRISEPYLRFGYGFTAFHFSRADAFGSEDNARLSDQGYFSPNWFVNNYGSVGLNGSIYDKATWSIEGTLGIQQVLEYSSSSFDIRMSSTARAFVSIPFKHTYDLTVAYDFLNVGSAFRRTTLRATWKTHF